MMLRYSFGMAAEADAIESAVNAVLDAGLRTADMMADGCQRLAAPPWVTPFWSASDCFTGLFYSFFEKKEPKKL